MKDLVIHRYYNVAKRFSKAIYRKIEVNTLFDSVKEAKKVYNLKYCKYVVYLKNGNEKRVVLPKLNVY